MKSNSRKNRLPKYAIGTSITNYIEDPSEALAQNSINIAKAQYEAASNPFVMGLQALSGIGMQAGVTMFDKAGGFGKLLGKKATGGRVSGIPVEVEGDEVGETPDGQLLDFNGPSHENGGIETTLPEGTEIYSKRIKIGGESMADRKKKRESIMARYTKKSEAGDTLAKNALDRIKVGYDKEEELDRQIQDAISQSLQSQGKDLIGEREQHAYDPVVGNPYSWENMGGTYPSSGSSASTENTTKKKNNFSLLGDFSLGDALNIGGNIFQGVAPFTQTMQSRSTDIPNENMYKGYGEEGLQKLSDSENYLKQITDEQLKNLDVSRSAAMKTGRNSARGVNTMRALDLAAYQGAENQKGDIYAQHASQMANLLGQEASMENQQDRIVMEGAAKADLANRQDKGAYDSAIAEGLRSLGMTTAQAGKQLNVSKERGMMYNQLNQSQANMKVNPITGEIEGKATEALNLSPKEKYNILEEGWKNPEIQKLYKDKQEYLDHYNNIEGLSPDILVSLITNQSANTKKGETK